MPGGGKLRIGAEEIASPTEQVTEFLAITVSDTGFGMPPEVLEHAFEPFFTTKEMGKGSGLGLSMVYGFAQQSGGYVNISSEVGAGTSVTIVLPAVPADGPPVAAGSGVPALPSGKERVLVVEDEPHVLQFVTTQLLNLGYEVTAVSTGVDALDLLAKEAAFDLLFSDVVLPKGVSGVELARRAKRLRPALKVLLTSGYPEEVFEQHGRPEEGTRVLRKPYRRAELAETLRTVLRSPGA
jgi:CheY-like chemotaxis protein